ncbi:MAG: hypothetical protein KAS32_28390 [Candidatus Peribacteraceae bacterium]|nr:hypothetical protein [Candidatus Peribacteraceae bacterium]
MKPIKCFFGFHAWEFKDTHDLLKFHRVCSCCDKRQQASYNPAYGSTNWS